MAQRHDEITATGTRVYGISVDSPEQNSALVQNLMLPFPILSDSDRTHVIGPYGVIDALDRRDIARPAAIVITPEGVEAFRMHSRDYADRPMENTIIEALRELELPATSQPLPQLGPAEPGPHALRFTDMVPYYRGARFAVHAMGIRFPEARDEADAYMAQLDRYIAAAKVLFKAKQ
ncbi:MAG: peroxiredoxin family protein [bacterium]|nr:peroxiredoxin family protein [bacterium]